MYAHGTNFKRIFKKNVSFSQLLHFYKTTFRYLGFIRNPTHKPSHGLRDYSGATSVAVCEVEPSSGAFKNLRSKKPTEPSDIYFI